MSSSNSFNICPRCGNSNVMNAKYCSRCGGELKLPEEPIVCHNCRTRNSPMANFCRNCGAELKVGYATKICTRCGSEVPAEQSVCTCGYVFAHTGYASPIPVRADGSVDTTGVTATGIAVGGGAVGGSVADDGVASADVGKGKKGKKEKKERVSKGKDDRIYSNKGGRGFAIVALVLLLVFAYLVIAPFGVRPSFLSGFDKGMYSYYPVANDQGVNDDAVHNPLYGFDMVMRFVNALTSGSFGDTVMSNGGTVQAIIAVVVAVFALAVVAHLIVCIVRIIKPKRSRKPNWLFLALAALTTVVVGLIIVFNYVNVGEGFFAKVGGIFMVTEGWSLGYVLFAIPVYFWFFFLYSLIAKARVLTEADLVPKIIKTTPAE